MAYKILTRPISLALNSLRNYGTSGSFVNVSMSDQTGIATVVMQKPPVNSLNYEFLKEFKDALEILSANKAKGMILTSSLNTVFSAGLDILEMYKPNLERARAFWSTLQDVWIMLNSTPYPTVAAINGHSPAGGCLLALSCEYRIMVNNYNIGLNETKLGMVAPFWFISSMRNTISVRESELALTTGKLYTTEEAFKVGLIDEIASDKNDALTRSEKFFKKFDGVHPLARTLTKQLLRGRYVEELQNRKEEELEQFISFLQQPVLQKSLDIYLYCKDEF